MNLTPEQQAVGRRNFLKAVAGLPALAGLGIAAASRGPVTGGPVRVGFAGLGGEGRVLLAQVDPAYAEAGPFGFVALTGPHRRIARPLGYHEASPHGDMMLAGSYGLVEGVFLAMAAAGHDPGLTLVAG